LSLKVINGSNLSCLVCHQESWVCPVVLVDHENIAATSVAFHRVVFITSAWNGWRLCQRSGRFHRDLFTDNHVGTEDLILVLLILNLKAVTRAAVISIYGKIDAFTPHATSRVINVKSIELVNYDRICAPCPMPQSLCLGSNIIILLSDSLDLILIFRPKCEILDDINIKDLTVGRHLFLKRCVDI
jgi:hypothetical protein